MWVREKMVPKRELPKNIPLHVQSKIAEQTFVSWKIMLGKKDKARTN
jgi:hypothetical protein